MAFRRPLTAGAKSADEFEYAVMEAKHSDSFRSLAVDRNGWKQGGFDWIRSRLQRYKEYGGGEAEGTADLLLQELNKGTLKSYGSFYRSQSLYEFNFESTPVPNGKAIPPALGPSNTNLIFEGMGGGTGT